MKTFLLTILIIGIGFLLFLYWERKAKRDERKRTDELKKEIDFLLSMDEHEQAISN